MYVIIFLVRLVKGEFDIFIWGGVLLVVVLFMNCLYPSGTITFALNVYPVYPVFLAFLCFGVSGFFSIFKKDVMRLDLCEVTD